METPTRDRVKAALREEIVGMDIGERLLPERHLALRHQVSRSTMSRIMNELVKEGYLARRTGSGTFVLSKMKPVRLVGSTPNAQGELLLVYPDYFAYSIWTIVHALETAADRENYRLISIKMQPQSDYKAILSVMDECRDLRGLVVLESSHYTKFFWDRVDAVGVPIILFWSMEHAEGYRNVYQLTGSNYESGVTKAKALIEAGHRRIGWIPNEPNTFSYRECLRGMKQAFREAGLSWSDVVRPNREEGKFWNNHYETGYDLAREVLGKSRDLTALIVDTIGAVYGVLRALADFRLRCPDDVSLITSQSFDRLEEYSVPRLCTVEASPLGHVGAVMEILRDGGSDTHVRRVETILHMRESIRQLNPLRAVSSGEPEINMR